MSENVRIYAPVLLKEMKNRRIVARNERIRIFCLSNFHFETRFPLLKWIKKYPFSNLLNDGIAGTIIAFIIVVQALAISLIMGVPGEIGIYSCLFGGFVNFLFGTSKDVSIGPSLLAAVIIVRYNPSGSPIIASLIAFFVGIVFLLMSFLNMGFLMEFISYPVLTGWITSGAVTIFISQVPSWFGISISNMSQLSSYELIYHIFAKFSSINKSDLFLGTISFLICSGLYFIAPHVSKIYSKIQDKKMKILFYGFRLAIIARVGWIILMMSAIGYSLKHYPFFETATFLKAAPTGLPKIINPFQPVVINNKEWTISEILLQIYPSFFLVPIVLIIETLAGARNFGKQFGYQVDNNQEFMCLGITNLLNSFFSGYPVGGALARTSINALSGTKSLFSGLITSIFLIPGMLWLMPLIKYVSKASLGACVCSAALTQIQIASLKNLYKIKKIELLPWVATFLFGLYKLEVGMLVGFFVSASFIMFRELRPRIHSSYDRSKDTVTLLVKGAIHFPGAYSISTRIRTLPKTYPSVKKIIIDCSNMYETDTSVVEEMREAIQDIEKKNITVILKHLKKGAVHNLVLKAGLSKCVLRGMRSGSCIVEFNHQHHFVPFHDNPRDLYQSTTTMNDEDVTDDFELEENSANYLYTVRSIAGTYMSRT